MDNWKVIILTDRQQCPYYRRDIFERPARCAKNDNKTAKITWCNEDNCLFKKK